MCIIKGHELDGFCSVLFPSICLLFIFFWYANISEWKKLRPALKLHWIQVYYMQAPFYGKRKINNISNLLLKKSHHEQVQCSLTIAIHALIFSNRNTIVGDSAKIRQIFKNLLYINRQVTVSNLKKRSWRHGLASTTGKIYPKTKWRKMMSISYKAVSIKK